MKTTTNKLVEEFQKLHEKKAKLEEEIVNLDVEMYGIFRALAQEKESSDNQIT